MARKINKADENYGNPEYYELGASVAKFRKIARDKISAAQKVAYSAALVKAVRAKQDAWWRTERALFKPNCASGTFINNGADLHEALGAQNRARIEAQIGKDRREAMNAPDFRNRYRDALVWGRFANELDIIVAEFNGGNRIVDEILGRAA